MIQTFSTPDSFYPREKAVVGYADFYMPELPYVRYHFVKTGPIASGKVNFTDLPTTAISVDKIYTIITITPAGSVDLVVPSCLVNTPVVHLGTHNASEFRGIGTGTASATAFNVELEGCPQLVRISYRMDAVTGYADQAQSVVELEPGAMTATGIGVQLLNEAGSAPHPMGSPLPVSPSGELSYTLAFKARHFQTASAIQGGQTSALMTITLLYD